MTDLIKVIILSIVEGLTEFIPVSSTGHLIIFEDILKPENVSDSFSIFIQLGAILAVVFLYLQRFKDLLDLKNLTVSSKSFKGFSGILKLLLAFIPAAVVGVLFHSSIKEKLFNINSVAIALIAGSVFIFITEYFYKKVEVKKNNINNISFIDSFVIGLFQCLSLIPGFSRSLSTICGGMLLKYDRVTAASFSFILAVPVMVGAVFFDLFKSYQGISISEWKYMVLGFILAFIFSLFAIKFFINLLGKISLKSFAIYRILLGIIVLIS